MRLELVFNSVAVAPNNHALLLFTIFFQPVLGKLVRRPTKLDKRLVRELKALADPEDPYDTVTGTTMCASDFYEGGI